MMQTHRRRGKAEAGWSAETEAGPKKKKKKKKIFALTEVRREAAHDLLRCFEPATVVRPN